MPSHRFFRAYPLISLALATLTATAGDIQFSLEEPKNGSIYSGVSNIRGWAISTAGIRNVELLVDGVSNGNIPSGGLRPDMANAYPNYPNSSQSGFSMIFNYSSLTAGAHTLSVNVVDNDGSRKSATVSFNAVGFRNPYISDPARVSLNAATITDDNDKSISISNLQADGQLYNVRLEWRTETQGFALTSISPVGGGSARWSALTNVCCATGPLTYQVTIDGVTKSSTINSCGSNPSLEGFASTTPGAKNWVARVVSSACSVNSQGSGTDTLASDACYTFVLNKPGNELINSFGLVTCPSSSANAETLREESQVMPMAIYPMHSVDPSGSGQEKWNQLRNIVEP